MEDSIVSYHELKKLVAIKFEKANIPHDHAETVAEVLVHADLRNVHSHGVMRTKQYIERIMSGGINKNPNITVKSTGPVSVQVDGNNGLGQVIAKRAMESAINLSKDNGVGVVGVTNSEHCGALSYFVELAAKEDMIGMGTTNANKLVAPYGGAEPFFGTNPIAYGFPAENHPPVILDMATSNVAFGKVLHARERGQLIPDTWGMDNKGQSTTNPHDVSVLLPIAGPKGYGLGMVVDILSGILTGSPFGSQVLSFQEYKEFRSLGHFFLVINPDIFIGKKQFKQQIDSMIDSLHKQKSAEGFKRVMVPGEPEQIECSRRLKEGIPISKTIYDYLVSDIL